MKTLKELIGEQIKIRRQALGWSQRQLARELGSDASNVRNYEEGIHAPGAYTLYDLANIFCCSVDDLMGRTHDIK
jgi:transcriptional regulator with XRE-family HTH domain